MHIVRALDELHRSFPRLNYQKCLPCNCAVCAAAPTPHFFDLTKLLDRLAHNKETIECDKPPYEAVVIRSLLDETPVFVDGGEGAPHIYNNHYYGDIIGGDKVGQDKVGGDKISIGDISDAQGVAVGRQSRASK